MCKVLLLTVFVGELVSDMSSQLSKKCKGLSTANGSVAGRNPSVVANPIMECHIGVAWPSVILAAVTVFSFLFVSLLGVYGVIPIWLGMILNIVALYYLFTPLHDATHGTISGNDKDMMWLNHLVGYVTGAVNLYDYKAYRYLHTLHHRFPNDPELDPDYWIKADSKWSVLWHNLTIMLFYQYYFLRHVALKPFEPGNFRLAVQVLGFNTLVLVFWYWAVVNGYGWELLGLWILPNYLSAALLGWSIGYFLHTDGLERYDHTDVVIFKGRFAWLINRIYCFQNFHMVHHLYPRIPFYLYEKAFAILKPKLRQEGTKIVSIEPVMEMRVSTVNADIPSADISPKAG